jgi:hypothetical protein
MMDIYGLNWDSRLKYIYPHYLFRIFKKNIKTVPGTPVLYWLKEIRKLYWLVLHAGTTFI